MLYSRKRVFHLLNRNKMEKSYRIIGLRLLSKSGGLVFCDNCEKIVGSINKQGYRYLNISISCTCGNHGSLEISKPDNTSDPYERLNQMPMDKNGVEVCKYCKTPMFGVIVDRVRSFSFYSECICGEKYDTKPNFPKRLGETVQLLKIEDLKNKDKE